MRRIFLFIMLLLSVNLYSQTRRALVVGIGKYPKETGWQTIHGDVDADSITCMLQNAGFDDVVTLKNSAATKASIVEAFHALAHQSSEGDIVYVHFSGHGQQMIDRNSDESDKRDESWIPYDAYRKPNSKDRGEKHLVDDEVGVLLDAIQAKIGKSGRIVVVVDACHSGTSTRGEAKHRGTSIPFVRENQVAAHNSDAHAWLLISACRDDQLNSEMSNPRMGLLSYAICTAIRYANGWNNARFFAELQRIVNRHKSQDTDQTIMVSGDTYRFNIVKILSKP